MTGLHFGGTMRRVFGGLLAGALLLASSGAWAADQIKRGGTMVAAILDNPAGLSTGVSTAIETIILSGQIFNTLIKMNAKFEIEPSLAKTWTISPDGLTYTFNLERGVKWHDGKPFTSADVQFSLMEVNRKYNILATGAYKGVTSIETPDDFTVVFKLKEPDPAFFPWAFCQTNFAAIMPKHLYEGKDPRTNPANNNPVGTGPFKLKEWVRGSHITLEKNQDYFKKDDVYLDRLVFQIIPDPAARQLALEKGDIDHIPYVGLAPSSIEPLAKRKDTQVIDSVRPALGEIIIFLNLRQPQLAKKEVRKAMAHAIDRELLVKLALNGRGKVATGPIRSDNPPFYNSNVPKYAFDPALANKMLDEAGMPRGAGGMRFKVRLDYQANGESGALQSAADIIKEELKAVGIDVVPRPMDGATYIDASAKWEFDMSMGSFGTGPDPAIAVSRVYLTENTQHIFPGNVMGYSNKTVDDLLNKADVEMNLEKRGQLYQQASAIMVDELPAFWLWEKYYPLAIRTGLLGLPSGAMHSEVFENVGWAK